MKRPGFQKMLTAIEAGYISAVFVKDLSRLGRNYIEVGKLTEEFFPLHDIRLVAVSDGVDSDEGKDDFTPFKNIMNEYYAKDISKKRRIVNKMKGNAGVPLSPPPYGYIKKPDDPRFWVVEPEAAEVVRRIYRMALEGYGLAETAACRRWRGQSHLLLAQSWDEPGRVKKHRGAYQVGAYHRQEDPHLAGILRRCHQLQKLLQVLQDEKAD